MKKVLFTKQTNVQHWVGDGFHVKTVFSYNDIAKEISPFLMLDYAAPKEFTPTDRRRGVESHPHRGMETVTIVYKGQVEHRDSAGGGGVIQANDIQWMTAGSGLVHEEKHGNEFSKTGGPFEMVQLWVNLAAKDKMTAPRYQALLEHQTPIVNLPDSAGTLRVIAGQYQSSKGPALTFSNIDLWDLRVNVKSLVTLKTKAHNTAALFVLNGKIKVSETHTVSNAELVVLDPDGETVSFYAEQDSTILFMGGQPIHEPIVGHGPFVMNSVQEINQAIQDYQDGKMGKLP
jgi:quercetin 2,3-dioxygenase